MSCVQVFRSCARLFFDADSQTISRPRCWFCNYISCIWRCETCSLVEFGVRLLYETNNATRMFLNMSSQETVSQHNQENMTDAATKVLLVNCAVNVPLALMSIIGNSLVLHAARKSPILQSPSLILLCGLAMSDLAVGALVQPLFIAHDLITLYSRSQRLQHVFMGVYDTFGFSLCGISLCTVTAVGVDRLIAVERSLHYPSIVTIPRVRRLLVTIWTTLFILTIARFWQKNIGLISVGVIICTCLCISIACHVKIYKTVRYHQNAIQLQFLAVETNTGNVNNKEKSLKLSAFNALIVFLVLVICYSPYLVTFYVINPVNPIDTVIARSLTSTIVFINSSLNPFLYCWRICEIREGVKQTCRKLVCSLTN